MKKQNIYRNKILPSDSDEEYNDLLPEDLYKEKVYSKI